MPGSFLGYAVLFFCKQKRKKEKRNGDVEMVHKVMFVMCYIRCLRSVMTHYFTNTLIIFS